MAFKNLLSDGKLFTNLSKAGTPGFPVGFSKPKSKSCCVVVWKSKLFQKR